MSPSLVARSNAQPPPVHARLSVAALQPGDVLLFGVFERECKERLCSDVVSILNVLGAALFSDRFAGVPAAWACHAAIYAGDNTLVHATGPDTTFVLAAEPLDRYLAEHPRLCTVFRANDAALARRAAALAVELARVAGAARRYSVPRLLVQLALQAVYPGRSDAALAGAVRRAIERDENPFDAKDALLSCSSLVSTLFHVAARGDGRGIRCDLSPYDLFVELSEHRAWRVHSVAQPEGLASTPLPDLRARRAPIERPNALRSLSFALSLLGGSCVVLLFALGLGRALHRRLLRSRSGAEPAAAPALEGARR